MKPKHLTASELRDIAAKRIEEDPELSSKLNELYSLIFERACQGHLTVQVPDIYDQRLYELLRFRYSISVCGGPQGCMTLVWV